jgi:hypothetical protein
MYRHQTIDNVLTNVNRAGDIPKWFGVNKDCAATPGLDGFLHLFALIQANRR